MELKKIDEGSKYGDFIDSFMYQSRHNVSVPSSFLFCADGNTFFFCLPDL